MATETQCTCGRVGVPFLLLALVCLSGCLLALTDREFYRCHSMDFQNRETVGLIAHLSPGMSEGSFADAFQAHSAPRTKLMGPFAAADRLFGGTPLRIVAGKYQDLTFTHAYLIEDKSGCPLWRYFFDESGLLVGADTMYHEFGSFFFFPHSLSQGGNTASEPSPP